MKMYRSAALLASAFTLTSFAHASGPDSCQGKVVLDTVYQHGTGDKFEYFFQLRNATGASIRANVEVGGFPQNVSVFSRMLPGITLDAHANKQIRFATGQNNQINDGSVSKGYDTRPSGSKPYVVVMGCK